MDDARSKTLEDLHRNLMRRIEERNEPLNMETIQDAIDETLDDGVEFRLTYRGGIYAFRRERLATWRRDGEGWYHSDDAPDIYKDMRTKRYSVSRADGAGLLPERHETILDAAQAAVREMRKP